MKILILADLHSNLEALTAFRQAEREWDHLLFLGDAVDYGPSPAECVEFIRRSAAIAIKGNHDAAVAEGSRVGFYQGVSPAIREWNRSRCPPEELEFLRGLPLEAVFEAGGARFHLAHGAPSDPLNKYLTPLTEQHELERELALAKADLLLVGHTHWPMLRRVGSGLIFNPGSLGQPRDGNPRASYGVWEDGDFQVRRLEYPVQDTARRLREALGEEAAGPLAEILRRGR